MNHVRYRALEDAAAMTPGFANPVLDAQRVFRLAMMAMAEPGTIHDLGALVIAPGFAPAMTALALTLTDFETPVWTDAGEVTAAYLQFHTGAPSVARHSDASFAFVTRTNPLPSLSSFRQGSLDYPDTSCTIVIEVSSLVDKTGWVLTGPGVRDQRHISAPPLSRDFAKAFVANRQRFPLGVDVILCAGHRIAALPRSATLSGDGG
jgi:alpha-D-ribose 1-methylphosphonate 5-triphosphate synthase subunit PhnH